MANPRVAVLASGGGTTAAAAAKAWAKDPDGPRIELIICNNPDAPVLERFKDIETVVINSKNADEEQAILDKLLAGDYDLVWLAGYMKKLGPKIVEQFGWREDYKSPYQAMMLNTHPGLLPATAGLHGVHVQEFVLSHPGQAAGHTLHVVAPEYDAGPTVVEREVEIMPGDTPEILFERVKASEQKHLPHDIAKFISDRKLFLDGR